MAEMLWKWRLGACRTVCMCADVYECLLRRQKEGEARGRGEREGERLKVTDVSSLTMRNMISSLPVIQMYRP